MAAASTLRTGVVRSLQNRGTLRALGLERIGRVRSHPDNDQIRGMIHKVRHLVVVEGGQP